MSRLSLLRPLFLGPVLILLGSGCEDPEAPKSQLILQAQMGPGPAGQTACGLVSQKWIEVGKTDPAGKTIPVPDGERSEFNNAVATIVCTVTPEGDGYRVDANVQLAGGPTGGTVAIKGKFKNDRGIQSGIRAIFQKADTGSFEQSDCQVEYGPNMGVSAGRVWGKLVCERMSLAGQNRECKGQAEFRFENCTQ